MINHILLIFSTIGIYEFIKFINLKSIIIANFKTLKKIMKLFTLNNVSDFRKEKLIFYYSKSLFVLSLKIFAVIISIILFIFFLNLLSVSFLNLIISVFGIFEITLLFIIYHTLRRRIYAKL